MKKILLLSVLSSIAFLTNAQKLETVALKAVPTPSEEQSKQAKAKMQEAKADQPKLTALTNTADVKLEETLALKETEFNFGKIPQGKPVTHIFTVTNIGKTAFKLDNVQASCGCTTPVWDREKTIAAGTSSDITVGYNAAAEGTFAKTITITYNGTQTKVLQIKGEVWKTPATSAPTNGAINDLKN